MIIIIQKKLSTLNYLFTLSFEKRVIIFQISKSLLNGFKSLIWDSLNLIISQPFNEFRTLGVSTLTCLVFKYQTLNYFKMRNSKNHFALILICLLFSLKSFSQLPEKVLVGYWHNWDEGASLPFLELNEIDDRYNVVCLSFAVASGGDPTNMQFNMYSGSSYDDADLTVDIASKQAEGKVVLMSIGGATGSFRLTSTADKNGFVSDMKTMIQEYGVDGIDIDLEKRSNVCMYSGTIQTPTDVHVTNMITALQELLTWYQTTYSKKMILTMAPETVYVQGGLSSYQVNNICGGAYLPIIEALGTDLDLLMVQLYNSGEMFDLDLGLHYQGTQSFITSQIEAIIRGFDAVEELGTYSGLNPNQVAVALPSCPSAGSGYIAPSSLKPALNYLLGLDTQVGSYTLKENGGYPELRGIMTWSINNDALSNCASSYEYAQVYEDIFQPLITSNSNVVNTAFEVYPNPANDCINVTSLELIEVFDMNGRLMKSSTEQNIYVEDLASGVYFIKSNNQTQQFVKK